MAELKPNAAEQTSFAYVAKDIDGKIVRGEEIAENLDELYSILLAKGLYFQSAAKKRSSGKKRQLKSQTLSEFCQQLSSLLGAGVNLSAALTIISQEEGLKPELKRLYDALLAEVRKGTSLSAAMEAQGVFPEIMLGMIRAGESSGDMAAVSKRLSVHFTKEHQLNQQVRSAMTYPAILGVLAVAVVIVIMTFVLPQFEGLFEGMTQLPKITLMLMGFSDFLVKKWYVLVIILVLAAVGSRVLLSVNKIRMALDKFKINMPILGRLNKVIYTARFARTLSSLYSSGVPIVSALETGRDTVGNSYIASRFERVLVDVRAGKSLSSALEGVDGFVKKLVSTVRVGEETGQLETMLDSVAEFMEYDASQATKRMLTLLEPVLLVIMALVAGFIMIAVMLPIIQSYGAIEGSAGGL